MPRALIVLSLCLTLSGCGWVSARFDELFGASGTLHEPAPKTAPLGLVTASNDPRLEADLKRRLDDLSGEVQAWSDMSANSKPPPARLAWLQNEVNEVLAKINLTRVSAAPSSGAPKPAPSTQVAMAPAQRTAPSRPTTPAMAPQPAMVAEPVDPMFADMAQYGLHLASYRSEQKALLGFRQYRQSLAPLIDDLQPRVLGVDFNDGRGLFYRLKVGPFGDRASAEKACAAIQDRGDYCKVENFTGTPMVQASATR